MKLLTDDNIPQTDAEALEYLTDDHAGIQSCMRGIYDCRRKLGDGIIEALVAALELRVKERPRISPNDHLIAAAPDLYAAMATVEMVLGMTIERAYPKLKTIIDSALAKAKGKTEATNGNNEV